MNISSLQQMRIKRFRKGKEEAEKEFQLANKPGYPTINIYTDESGKSGKDKYIVIGGLWILDKARMEELRIHLTVWRSKYKEENQFPKEFHFTEMSKNQLPYYKALIDEILSLSDMNGFKAVAYERGSNRYKSQDEMIYSLYYQHVHHGIEHEVNSGRITLPRGVNFWKDKEDGNDRLFLSELEQHLITGFETYFKDQLDLDIFSPIDSFTSIFIQLADLYTGSISRVLNTQTGQPKNHKDEFAEYVFESFKLDLTKIEDQAHDMAMIHFL